MRSGQAGTRADAAAADALAFAVAADGRRIPSSSATAAIQWKMGTNDISEAIGALKHWLGTAASTQ